MPIPESDIKKDFDQAAAFCYRPKTSGIEILLVRTDSGRWIFPKGKIEKGEEAWQAAQREALEEAEIALKQDRQCTYADELIRVIRLAKENLT